MARRKTNNTTGARSRRKKSVNVESTRHRDKRKNIPTRELQDFVKEDEAEPKTILYPRDPSLDPQLVWKGKDEQDQKPLAVPAVPIFIQEKIHPQAIIEDLRKAAQAGKPRQLDLYGDFNGLPFEQHIDFYHHEANWSNRMILGDSLLVMTSLAAKEGLKGKVQMIYMDPPYGIKFGSNWQVSTRKRTVNDGNVQDVTRQPEQIKAFRDTWKLGIHSYLAYLRDRLVVARELLTETGSIFVQINDENLHLVRCLLDEVFGRENFVAVIPFTKTRPVFEATTLRSICDYLLWYCKNKASVKYQHLYSTKNWQKELAVYTYLLCPDGTFTPAGKNPTAIDKAISNGATLFKSDDLIRRPNPQFAVRVNGRQFIGRWRTNADGMRRLALAERLFAPGTQLRYIYRYDDFPVKSVENIWLDTMGEPEKVFVVQTNTKVVERCILMTTDPGDLVLDPTCGSGTTAYVAEQWGRRWITIDTSRVALALARTRLMAAKFPYYILADSPEGVAKEAEITGKTPPAYETKGDIKKGFVYKRVPHITLKSIAHNEEIDAIHARWQEKLEPLRARLNNLLKQSWEEWEVPRETEKDWPDEAKKLLAEWWEMRRQRQKEIDESIARHADSELLYDQPYEDKKTVRVTGPFTVESLSPHRVLSPDEEIPASEVEAKKAAGPGQFETMIIENLKKAGVENRVKNERLRFDRLEPFAGQWIHAEGEYTEKDGTSRRVAVCIGPEHGTVGPELVKEAAKEAVKGLGFDLLLVCGFAFDPHAYEAAKEFSPRRPSSSHAPIVAEATKQYGKLMVLLARMNPDLAMGDELLKKTGAGNLFMVFGEPDIEIEKHKDGKLTVEIKGVDVYDPTTGEIRSNSTDDIACWFIDTDYNGESFFVRHAYFTGADRPYEKLKRALRAEIDEAAWAQLYSTRSRPFDPPSTGKIAVKVINHYGDEVLKVYDIR